MSSNARKAWRSHLKHTNVTGLIWWTIATQLVISDSPAHKRKLLKDWAVRSIASSKSQQTANDISYVLMKSLAYTIAEKGTFSIRN